MGEMKGAYRALVGKPEGKSVDGRVILKWIFERLDGGEVWTGSIWPRIGTGGGSCEYVYEHSVSIKCGEFLE